MLCWSGPLARHPAVCGGLHPVLEALLGGRGLKVKVKRVSVHQRVMEDRLHVTFKPLDGHVIQVTGEPLLVGGEGQAGATVAVAVEWAVAGYPPAP